MQSFKTVEFEQMSNKLKAVKSDVSHHLKYWIVDSNGKRLYPPYSISKGRKDAPGFVTEKVRKALFLDKDEFRGLIACRMNRDEYLRIRRTRDIGSYGG
jgi:hypothetical protein